MKYTISKTSPTNYQAERDNGKDYINAADFNLLLMTVKARHPEAEIEVIETTYSRIEDLEEKKQEYILNESVTADNHPSWGELADAQAGAEDAWNETEESKELTELLKQTEGA